MSSTNNRSVWDKLLIPIIVAVIGGVILLYIEYGTDFFNNSQNDSVTTEITLSDNESGAAASSPTLLPEQVGQEADKDVTLVDDQATGTPTTSSSPSPMPTKVPTPTVPPTETLWPFAQPGMILADREEWYQDNLGITLVYYGQQRMHVGDQSYQGDCIQLLLQNYTSDTIFLDVPTTLSDFYIEDPDGNQYRFNWYRLGNEDRYVNSFDLASIEPAPVTEIGLCRVGPVIDLERWEYFRIGIRHLSTVRNAVWQINVRSSASAIEEIPQPTSTPLVNAQPGMVLTHYGEWYQDNLGITLVYYGQPSMHVSPGDQSYQGDCVQLLVRNYTDEKLFLDDLTTLNDIYIEDPNGNRYNFNWYREGNVDRYNNSFGLTSLEPLSATEIGLCIVAPVVDLERWEYFIFGINRLVHIRNAQWQINLR